MRVLVTGATNLHGEAIVRALAQAGHHVRAFGVPWEDGRFDGVANVKVFPGWVEVPGSIEPVLSERQVLVHAACLDPPPRGRAARREHAVRIRKGTLHARYAAEREQVDHFVHVTPLDPPRPWAAHFDAALDEAERTHGRVQVHIVDADDDPAATARGVADLLADAPVLGGIVGGHDNAVTA